MKRQTKTYFRTLYISLVIIMCISLGWIGISTAWENTVRIAFGEYKNAIEINSDTIRILDFVIK
ncbi:MAG: hypothetical protein E7521_04510 [Ruminococcaceae bacterium]|mgnify:CR=1 FL=1|nr:hypothetical protein [Oscillospiraceae bacterium]